MVETTGRISDGLTVGSDLRLFSRGVGSPVDGPRSRITSGWREQRIHRQARSGSTSSELRVKVVI